MGRPDLRLSSRELSRREAHVFFVVVIVLGGGATHIEPILGFGPTAPAAQPGLGRPAAAFDRGTRWAAHAARFSHVSHEPRRGTKQLQTAHGRGPTGFEQLPVGTIGVSVVDNG